TLMPSSLFAHATAPTALYTLSLHDALPIWLRIDDPETGPINISYIIEDWGNKRLRITQIEYEDRKSKALMLGDEDEIEITDNDIDRKSTRLNSSHVKISYAVFCLKKKKKIK